MTAPSHPHAEAIDRCWDCHRLCLQLLLELEPASPNADLALLHALTDGFELSRVCAHALLRRSHLSPAICGVCAVAARRVAEACLITHEVHEGLTACAVTSHACARACDVIVRLNTAAASDRAAAPSLPIACATFINARRDSQR